MRLFGEHGRRDPQLEALATFSGTTLHTATAEQHRDASLDAGAKTLAALELPALLIGFALGRFGAAPLWDAHHLDALCCSHDVTSLSLKKPRSELYNSGTSPKVCL